MILRERENDGAKSGVPFFADNPIFEGTFFFLFSFNIRNNDLSLLLSMLGGVGYFMGKYIGLSKLLVTGFWGVGVN